jgi:hypothetical protein
MKFAGMEIVEDASLPEGEFRIGYPPQIEVWTRPGGEVFELTTSRAGDKFIARLHWAPDILAMRIRRQTSE